MDAHNFGVYEELYNIPLITMGPGIAKGVDSPARVGLHDINPTLCELAGIKYDTVPDSKSFSALLKNPESENKNYTTGFSEYFGTRMYLTQRLYMDGPWKFAFNGFDFDELYNIESDPAELNNLINDPSQKERIKEMMGQIWKKTRDTNDKTLKEAHYFSVQFAVNGPDYQVD